ncbi:hypothetical protein KA005_32500 [bacterium]|nr:hypothetical protein [bacterium]
MTIPILLTSYLNETKPPKKQYEIADEVNEYIGWQYITPMAVSYWINNVYLPDIKTARIIRAAAPPGKLRDLFDAIIKELQTSQPVQS